jgi:hypothetical protein
MKATLKKAMKGLFQQPVGDAITSMSWLRRCLIPLVLLLLWSHTGQAAAAADAETLIVEDLSCRGNVATSGDFILGHVYLAPGDTVDEEELGNARLRLGSLPRLACEPSRKPCHDRSRSAT